MYFVYAIISLKDGRIYVGMTSNLKIRLDQHNSGYVRSTKSYLPWEMFYSEACESREKARCREKYWKGGSGKEKLRKLISK